MHGQLVQCPILIIFYLYEKKEPGEEKEHGKTDFKRNMYFLSWRV
jgi:hypothetical protein